METKFQTSFIPKKTPVTMGVSGSSPAVRKQKSSILMTLATILFLLSLVAAAGSYGWKYYLISAQADYKKQLAQRKEQFNLDLIEQLKQVNIKITLARQLMTNHVALSQIFDVVSRLTAEKVRFFNMDVSATQLEGISNSEYKINLHGNGLNYSTVAFQSDVLAQLEQLGLRKIVKNPILSDPSQDEKGSVSFNFSASIDPNSVSYEKLVIGSGVSDIAPPASSQ